MESDEELEKQINTDFETLRRRTEELKLLLLLNGPYDKNDCILEIHSGAGGTDDCDLADIFYSMYSRFCV